MHRCSSSPLCARHVRPEAAHGVGLGAHCPRVSSAARSESEIGGGGSQAVRRGLTLLQPSGERNAQTPFCEFKVYSGRFDTCGYCESATTAGPASTFPSSVTPSSGGENIRDLPSQRRPHWQCRAVNRPVPELPRLTPESPFPSPPRPPAPDTLPVSESGVCRAHT